MTDNQDRGLEDKMLKSASVLAVLCVLVACGDVDDVDLSPGEDEARAANAKAHDAKANAEPLAPDAGAAAPLDSVVGDAAAAQAPDAGPAAPALAPDATAPSAPVSEPAPCLVAMHRDADADGFGEAVETMVSCTRPTGYVADATDCYDQNPQAFPGSTEFHDAHRGDGSFDYDCDGAAAPADTTIAQCPEFTAADAHCPPGDFHVFPRIPTDNLLLDECTDELRTRMDAVRNGWYLEVPACGTLGPYNVSITFARETPDGYACSAPPPSSVRLVTCR